MILSCLLILQDLIYLRFLEIIIEYYLISIMREETEIMTTDRSTIQSDSMIVDCQIICSTYIRSLMAISYA